MAREDIPGDLPAVGRLLRLARAIAGAGLCAVFLPLMPAAAQQPALQRYGKADGLANLAVRCVMQDRARFVWVCTENGLFRFDGHRMRRIGDEAGLGATLIYGVLEDGHGRLWVRTSSDLYLGEGGRFRAVRPNGRALRSAATADMSLLADGRLAIIVSGDLLAVSPSADAEGSWQVDAYFSPGQIAAIPELGRIDSVVQGPDGRLWLGCSSAVCDSAPQGVRVWSRPQGVPREPWMNFHQDRDGRVWARSRTTLLMLPPGGGAFERAALPDATLRGADTAAIAEAPDGSLLVSTGSGLARREPGGWRPTAIGVGMGSSEISSLVFDHEGSPWIGLYGGGVLRWLGHDRFESWTRAQGLGADLVWGLLRDPERGLLIGTRSDCRLLDHGSIRPCGIRGLPDDEVGAFARQADGTLWIGMRTTGELFSLRPGALAAQRVAALPKFSAMLVDARQRLWLPTRRGVYLMEAGDASPHRVSEDGEFLEAAEDPQGGVWMAGSDGLLRFADGTWRRAPLDDERSKSGFGSVAIDAEGQLWAASRASGILRGRIRDGELEEARWIDDDPFLVDASATFVRFDAANRVWIGTDFGVLAQNGSGWHRLTESDGLVWNDTDQSSFLADADGSVWIGTSGGLSHIVDPASALLRPPLELTVRDLRYGDRPVSAAQAWPWRRGAALDLELASFSFSRAPDTRLRYHIAGIDDAWFESANPQVHYAALPPGSYGFEAMLFDADHQQRSPIVALEFTVLPPWWSTLWFRGLLALLVLLSVAAAWRGTLRRIAAKHSAQQQAALERSQLLERASRDGLTGLWNRSTILDLLAHAIETRATGQPLAIAVLDVDHFKRVNDTHGHAAGDALLQELSVRLAAHLRQADLLGRYGGEELLLVMPGLPPDPRPTAVERLREAVAARAFTLGDRLEPVTVSIGVAWFEGGDSSSGGVAEGDTPDALFRRADAALYRAKREGRNRIVCALPTATPPGAAPSPSPEAAPDGG